MNPNNTDFLSGAIKEYCKRSFYNFVVLFWNNVEVQPFEDAPHIHTICDTLQARFKRGKSKQYAIPNGDILINCPPGSSKSRIISIFFPAWIWLIDPTTKFITYSYSYKIAEDLSSKSLQLINSKEYSSIVAWKIKSNSVSYFINNMGGSRFVTSTGGTVTGAHADIIIGDDPNSPQSIYSEAAREEARRFVSEVLPSRKTNLKKSFIITVQQRLHNEDASAQIIKQTKHLQHIVIPAIDKDGNSFSSRFPLEYLDQMKTQLGTSSFLAQYQQETQSAQGGIIKRNWLKEDFFNEKDLVYFIDPAYGLDKGDFTAIIGCTKKDNNLLVQFANQNRYEFPQLIEYLKTSLPPNAKVYIEGKANGKSIIQTLRKTTSFNIIELQTVKGKIERKHSVAPYFEGGRIILNSSLGYKEELINQIIFDTTTHDDLLDVLMFAIENLLKKSTGNYDLSFI